MSGTEDEDESDSTTGKVGRNEARKLLATWLNNVSVGFVLAGSLQPLLGLVQRQRSISLAESGLSAILFGIAVVAFFGAQRIAKRLED